MAEGKARIPRFGTISVEKEFITKEQLYEAMKEQIDRDLDGLEQRYLGSILYDLGFMSLEQIDEVVEALNE
ncbi:hypothetical protein ACFL0H_03650 [Thermodesulfobacteriota bacterium]